MTLQQARNQPNLEQMLEASLEQGFQIQSALDRKMPAWVGIVLSSLIAVIATWLTVYFTVLKDIADLRSKSATTEIVSNQETNIQVIQAKIKNLEKENEGLKGKYEKLDNWRTEHLEKHH